MDRKLFYILMEGKRLFRDSTKLLEAVSGMGATAAHVAGATDAAKKTKPKGILHSFKRGVYKAAGWVQGQVDKGANSIGDALKHPWTRRAAKTAAVAIPAWMHGAHHAGKAAEAAAWKYGVPAVAGAGALGYMAGNSRESFTFNKLNALRENSEKRHESGLHKWIVPLTVAGSAVAAHHGIKGAANWTKNRTERADRFNDRLGLAATGLLTSVGWMQAGAVMKHLNPKGGGIVKPIKDAASRVGNKIKGGLHELKRGAQHLKWRATSKFKTAPEAKQKLGKSLEQLPQMAAKLPGKDKDKLQRVLRHHAFKVHAAGLDPTDLSAYAKRYKAYRRAARSSGGEKAGLAAFHKESLLQRCSNLLESMRKHKSDK